MIPCSKTDALRPRTLDELLDELRRLKARAEESTFLEWLARQARGAPN